MSKKLSTEAKQALHTAVEQYAKTGNGKVLDATIKQIIADEALNAMAENAREIGLDYEPAQQQKPVAWVKVTEHWLSAIPRFEIAKPNEEGAKPVYLQPAKSKPWIGLDAKELEWKAISANSYASFCSGAQWAEANLREKNA